MDTQPVAPSTLALLGDDDARYRTMKACTVLPLPEVALSDGRGASIEPQIRSFRNNFSMEFKVEDEA